MTTSDKFYWHRYDTFYEQYLSTLKPLDILEFGVLNGESIKYWLERFPDANIVGADIMSEWDHPEWPMSPMVSYVEMDQGNLESIKQLFKQNPGPYQLIVEDGSHQPQHQINCLLESIDYLDRGGIYILEDLHTSVAEPRLNAYNVLLGIEWLKATNTKLDLELFDGSMFSRHDLEFLWNRIDTINVWHRALLPLRCYKCGSRPNLGGLNCQKCYHPMVGTNDSMSAVVVVK